jgi:amino acid adenylation domain-containing protein
LPLTSNGKVDKKQLPAPADMSMSTGVAYVAPRTDTETRLLAIWQEILGNDRISVKDSFFDLGGHSLKATRLASQIHKVFEVKLTLKDLFTRVVLEDQALLIDDTQQTRYNAITPVAEQADYELSSSQRRLWVLSQFAEGNVAYNIPAVYVLEGQLDVSKLEHAFNGLIARHEILRTVFKENTSGEIRQFITADSHFPIPVLDIRNEPDTALEALVQQEFVTPFDLSAGPLLRAHIYQVADNKWVFAYVMHHIVSDGWSMGILIKELLQLYTGSGDALSPLRIQYKDYAAWQQEQLSGEALASHQAYWLQQFEGHLPVLDLPLDKPRPAVKSYKGSLVSHTFDTRITNGVQALSAAEGGTLFMGLLAAVNMLLHRYTQQEDIIIGSPIAGRQHADLEGQIGFYLNTLALRTSFSGSDNYQSLIHKVKAVTLGAYEHQLYPFDTLVDELQLPRDMSRHPLFDVMVILQNTDDQQITGKDHLAGLDIRLYEGGQHVISKFDLLFIFSTTVAGLQLALEYNTDIYRPDTVTRLIMHLERLLDAAIAAPAMPVNQLGCLSEAEQQQLLTFASNMDVGYPRDKTLVDFFEAQVLQTPNNIAVVCGNEQLTYLELNEQANQLAHYLRESYHVKPEDLVGILLDRSTAMIVAIIGIIKSGGAYVPIDPTYPQERIDYMLSDSNCKVLIDEQELLKSRKSAKDNPERVNQPADLAYVIYTSGTTGKPKGSLITHNNVVRLFKTDAPLFDFTASDVWTMFHSYCFDFSVWEMYGALLYGGKVVMVPGIIAKDSAAFVELLRSEGVTILNQTPSSFYNVIKQDTTGLQLRYVIFGGEALSPGKLAGWQQQHPSTQLINMYGITETTVHVTYKEITLADISANSSNIGRPIPTLQCYVLDQQQQLLPVGISGELYVGGEGVCRGYLNKKELTSQRFIDNPFKAGERLYRTGDKAKLLPNGDLEYAGRIDDQVKIRGYRIELGEIEHVLRRNEKISDVVVIARADAKEEYSLIAYVVSREVLHTTELRAALAIHLPVYMLPAYFVQLDQLPLTSNGKIDKKNLPDPAGMGMATGTVYVGPRNDTDQQLIGIWEELLGRKGIGIQDNFFDLGGHSLKANSVAKHIQKELGVPINIKDVFKNPTIETISDIIRADKWINDSKNIQKQNRNIVEI